MALIILTEMERQALKEAYSKDKLKDAPGNISDKTLILNYGDLGQKERLYEKEPSLRPQTVSPVGSGTETAGAKGSEEAKDNKPTAEQINAYLDLFKTMPAEGLTSSEVNALIDAKVKELEEAAKKDSEKAAYKMQKESNRVIRIINNKGRIIKVSRHTFDKFLQNDSQGWKEVPDTPAEAL